MELGWRLISREKNIFSNLEARMPVTQNIERIKFWIVTMTQNLYDLCAKKYKRLMKKIKDS